jgi:2-oxo-4-hydroxy-4-carboxy-5-ureidoimidazoline decarboxylase
MNLFTIAGINSLSRDEFVRVIGPVFERSPWIAEAAWANRPFASREALQAALCDAVSGASAEKQLGLICSHPDLADRLARAGTISAESVREQSEAGLRELTPEEIDQFQRNNAAYRGKFGFPFVICARLNRKEAIMDGFRARLANSREQEIQTALREIFKIAGLRLNDLISI